MNNNFFIASIFAWSIVGGFFGSLFGGFEILISALGVLMALDIITGILKAIMLKSEKSESGGLSSNPMFRGGIRKLLIFIIITLAAIADLIITPNGGTLVRTICISFYIATEGLSILENVAACGLPIPKKIRKVFDALKDKGEDDVD